MGITLCISGELIVVVAVWEMQQTSLATCKIHFLLLHPKSLLKEKIVHGFCEQWEMVEVGGVFLEEKHWVQWLQTLQA